MNKYLKIIKYNKNLKEIIFTLIQYNIFSKLLYIIY